MNCVCKNCKSMDCKCTMPDGSECHCMEGEHKCDATCPNCAEVCMNNDGACCCGKEALPEEQPEAAATVQYLGY